MLLYEIYDKQNELNIFVTSLKEKYPMVDIRLYIRGNDLKLDHIVVKKEFRKTGIGSAIMREICNFADKHGYRITLTTGIRDPHFGTTSGDRLKKFYSRFGFKRNFGKNKDYSLSDNMYR